jgi:ankyrin repeat protein
VFCQLEILRYCLPPSVRRTLDELPESLDETYERVLEEIKKPNRDHARRLLQCLVVATRPLRVEELAEVLAVDFDDAEGIPRLNPNWRWEDEEQALLTSCSSLIAIVDTYSIPDMYFSSDTGYSRVVQFSHFSVKEFLTSTRLTTSSKDVSCYHIDLEPAHTVLAQACLGVLLQRDDCNEENGARRNSPLGRYASQQWATHAQFKSVSSSLRKAMEYLFDLDKPYFAAWLKLHDIDIDPNRSGSSLSLVTPPSISRASPLYYAALCGLQGLVKDLVVKYPQHVNASGGYCITPLVAALVAGHFQTAKLLHHNGASANVRDNKKKTPLHSAASNGDLKMVQTLLGYDADVNAQDDYGWTPIHAVSHGFSLSFAIYSGAQSFPDVARFLLEHGADVNGRTVGDSTPLHEAVKHRTVEVMRVLLEHGANVGAEDKYGKTPLHEAAQYGRVEVVHVLLEHGANVGAEDKKGSTPLHEAAQKERDEVVRVLLDHGANVGAEDKEGRTPLHKAAQNRWVEAVRVLLEHGANVGAEDKEGRTPLHEAAQYGRVKVVRVLLEHGANVGAEDKEGGTPLHEAAQNQRVGAVRVLLEHGANVGAEDKKGRTPLHEVARHGRAEVVRMLLEHGANVGPEDKEGRTPLHEAAQNRTLGAEPVPLAPYGLDEVMPVLLEHGANVSAEDKKGRTPLHEAAQNWKVEVMRMLLEYDANVGAEDKEGRTPLHEAAQHGRVEAVRVLLEHGANVGVEDKKGRTPSHEAAQNEWDEVVRVLLEHRM